MGNAASWLGLVERRAQGRPEWRTLAPGRAGVRKALWVAHPLDEVVLASARLSTLSQGSLPGVPASRGHLCQVLCSGRDIPRQCQHLGHCSWPQTGFAALRWHRSLCLSPHTPSHTGLHVPIRVEASQVVPAPQKPAEHLAAKQTQVLPSPPALSGLRSLESPAPSTVATNRPDPSTGDTTSTPRHPAAPEMLPARMAEKRSIWARIQHLPIG